MSTFSSSRETRESRSSIELQSHSLQQVELEIVSGNIASRGASEILRRLRITQGRGEGNGTLEFQGGSLLQYRGYLKIQENKLKACSIVRETLYTSIRSHYESL
jgi:hypothetical protein